MIFKHDLLKYLERGERCETNKGYCGSALEFVCCPGGVVEESSDPAVQKMQARVRNHQETVNERFKNWGILATPYQHSFSHQRIFGAIAVLTQLTFKYNPLFEVEYND